MDDLLVKRERKKVRDLNLVPIIDMLTTVIFFLLLSTSFMEYTKLTVPPSKVSTITDPVAPPPLAPKLIYARAPDGEPSLLLTWAGTAPGQTTAPFRAKSPRSARDDLSAAVKALVKPFAEKYPSEKTLQIGLAGEFPYQDLIAVMDGARDTLPDIVLISYQEAEARSAKGYANAGGPGAEAAAGGHP